MIHSGWSGTWGSERLGSTTFSCWIPFIFATSWQVDAEILEPPKMQPGHFVGVDEVWVPCTGRQGVGRKNYVWCKSLLEIYYYLSDITGHHQGKLDIHFLLPKRRSVRTGTPPGQNSRLKTPVAHRISSWFHQQRIGPSAIKKKTQLGKKTAESLLKFGCRSFS